MNDYDGPAGDVSAGGKPGWMSHLASVPPTVLILGGFLTAPPMYGPFAKLSPVSAQSASGQ